MEILQSVADSGMLTADGQKIAKIVLQVLAKRAITDDTDHFGELVEAVHNVYYSGKWQAPGVSDEDADALWQAVRDAAGFEPGHSPE